MLISIYRNLNICVNVDNDRILILEATIDGFNYILINLHNANTEREQLTTIKNLNDLLKDLRIFMIKMLFLHEILTYRLTHGAGTYEKLIPLRFDT